MQPEKLSKKQELPEKRLYDVTPLNEIPKRFSAKRKKKIWTSFERSENYYKINQNQMQ